MPLVFVSHSTKDDAFADRLANELAASGIQTFIDHQNIQPGADWPSEIENAMNRSSVVLYVLSDASLNSQEVVREYTYAVNHQKTIIPLRIEAVGLPLRLTTYNWIDFTSNMDTAMHKLSDDLKRKLQALDYASARYQSLVAALDDALDEDDEADANAMVKTLTPDIQAVVDDVLTARGYTPYIAGEVKGIVSRLQDVWKAIYQAAFCLFDVSTNNQDVLIELGIAIALKKWVILLCKSDVLLPDALRNYPVLRYANADELRDLLVRTASDPRFMKGTAIRDFCPLCNRYCPAASVEPEETAYCILRVAGNRLPWRGVATGFTPTIAKYGMFPTDLTEMPPTYMDQPLCELQQKTNQARFVVFHTGSLAVPASCLTLGMAIGSLKPWLIFASRTDANSIPLILRAQSRVEYTELSEFNGAAAQQLAKILSDELHLQTQEISDRQAQRTLTIATIPPWNQLADWRRALARADEVDEALLGEVKIVAYDGNVIGQKYDLHPSRHSLRFGRDSRVCDVYMNTDGASMQHFRVWRDTDDHFYIEDLGSTNGTYLNGSKLTARHKTEIHFKDTIRAGAAQYMVWDERPLPRSFHLKTTTLTPILTIEFKDILPPTHLTTLDQNIILNIIHPTDSSKNLRVQLQAYYPLGRVLNELSLLMELSDITHHILYEETVLKPHITPMDLSLKSGSVLHIVQDRVENAMRETVKKISYCGRKCQYPRPDGTFEWRRGKQMGTLRQFFEATYYDIYKVRPAKDIKIDAIRCPTCGGDIFDDVIVGIREVQTSTL